MSSEATRSTAGSDGQVAAPLAVFADQVPTDVARSLDLAGFDWKAVSSESDASDAEPSGGWGGVILDCAGSPDAAWAFARTIRKAESATIPVLVLIGGGQLADLALRDELFDDFCLTPFHPAEFEARVRHLLWDNNDVVARSEIVGYGDLVLNLETYQATIEQRPLDLTYMEYELLKFLAQNPGKVFTREILLSRVWGYEYYGGARTVDVHVRRLRAKLGEEHANLIQTVRSVGYRFGQARWS